MNNKLLWEEYIDMADSDDVNKWSFDSLSFYPNGRHELEKCRFWQRYNLSHFEELPSRKSPLKISTM